MKSQEVRFVGHMIRPLPDILYNYIKHFLLTLYQLSSHHQCMKVYVLLSLNLANRMLSHFFEHLLILEVKNVKSIFIWIPLMSNVEKNVLFFKVYLNLFSYILSTRSLNFSTSVRGSYDWQD